MDVFLNINNNLNAYGGSNNSSTQESQEVTMNSPLDSKSQSQIANSGEANGAKSTYTKEELDDALKKVNNFLKDEKTHAEYSIHKDLGTIMIKIVDDEDEDKVIMEIPPEKILDMIASMCKQFGLLDKKA